MNNQQVRELVHSIINFTSDEVGRTLAASTSQEWSQRNNTEMLTDAQARALHADISDVIKSAAFSVLQKS